MSNIQTARVRIFFSKSRANLLVAALAALAVLIAGYFVLRTSAAGFFAATEPEKSTVSGNAKIVSDQGASDGQALQFGAANSTPAPNPTPTPTPTPTPNPTPSPSPSGSKPGSNNTGPTGTLTPINGMTITENGKVLQNVLIKGSITIKANNVTIRNFKIEAGGARYGIDANQGATGLVLEDGEIRDVDSAHIFGSNFTARRLELHESGGDALKPITNVTVERTWMHHLGKNVGSHADATQSRHGGSNLIYRNNNCDIPVNQPGYNSNACFILERDGGPIRGVVIEGNWMNGGNYTMYCEDTPGIIIKNNRFGRNFRYGISRGCPVSGNGNVWDDTGQSL